MKTLFPILVCSLFLTGCSNNPPPTTKPTLRTFGVTVRSTGGDVINPSGVIVLDSGEQLIGVNHNGRLQFETALPKWGGEITIEAEGYQSYVGRVVLDDMADVILGRLIAPLKRLRADGRHLVNEDGQPFVWRFVTGFRLVDHVADGNEAAAIAFLDWAKQTGFNGVRVLSSLCCWFDLTFEDGQRALPRTLELAQARGIYLEVVGLAGTRDRGSSKPAIAAHIRAVGLICERSPACAAIELANENAHGTQQGELTDGAFLKELRASIAPAIMVSVGSNCCGQSDEVVTYVGGNFITIHGDRSRDTWNRTRHVREMEGVSALSGLFVVDDEPIGAGEVDSPGRRSANPNEFFGRGVLSRIFGIGATFHLEAGLQAVPPGSNSVQQASAEAFVAGSTIVSEDIRLTYKNVGWHDSPVKGFNFGEFGKPNAAIRAYSGVGSRSILVLVGVSGDPGVVFQNSWRAGAVLADRPGIRVLEVVR